MHTREPLYDPFFPQYPLHHPHYYGRYPVKSRGFTLAQKTDCIRHELCIPNNVTMYEAVARANAIMGMKTRGSLSTQIDELIAQLRH